MNPERRQPATTPVDTGSGLPIVATSSESQRRFKGLCAPHVLARTDFGLGEQRRDAPIPLSTPLPFG
jgi:hypothetical protein